MLNRRDENLHRKDQVREAPYQGRAYEFFKTVAGPDETAYPAQTDNPTVYYARQLANVTFTKTVGAQALSYDETNKYQHLYNLVPDDYIEEGSVVLGFPKGDRWFTIDKVKGVRFLVVGHTPVETAYATGNLSKLDFDGNLKWTVDLGIDPTTSMQRRPVMVKIDESGNIYVAWNVSGSTELDPRPVTPGVGLGTVGGLIKLGKNGQQLWSHTFPAQDLTGISGFHTRLGNSVSISPDGTIWTGTFKDTDGNCLHRFDADGNLLNSWGVLNDFAVSSPSINWSIYQGLVGFLKHDSQGNCWFCVSGTGDFDGPFRVTPAGVVDAGFRKTFGTATGTTGTYSWLLKDDDTLVITGRQAIQGTGPPGLSIIQEWEVSSDTLRWSLSMDDFQLVSGDWIDANYSIQPLVMDGEGTQFYFTVDTQMERTNGDRYRFFGATLTGTPNTMAQSISDNLVNDVATLSRFRYLASEDAIFIADAATISPGNTVVQRLRRLNPTSVPQVWGSDLGATANVRCYSIDARA